MNSSVPVLLMRGGVLTCLLVLSLSCPALAGHIQNGAAPPAAASADGRTSTPAAPPRAVADGHIQTGTASPEAADGHIECPRTQARDLPAWVVLSILGMGLLL